MSDFQPGDQPEGQPGDQHAGQPFEQDGCHPGEPPAAHVGDQPAGDAGNQHAGQPGDQPEAQHELDTPRKAAASLMQRHNLSPVEYKEITQDIMAYKTLVHQLFPST